MKGYYTQNDYFNWIILVQYNKMNIVLKSRQIKIERILYAKRPFKFPKIQNSNIYILSEKKWTLAHIDKEHKIMSET